MFLNAIPPQNSYKRRFFTAALAGLVIYYVVNFATFHRGPTSTLEHEAEPGFHRIAKVSMLYGEPNVLYERALQSHRRHARRWGYPMHVLQHDIAVGFWNKPSYLLSLVVQELAKPPSERTEWLMWVDADSIILNPAIPAELFIPPSDLTQIHMVASKDQNGLNTGIIFLHVHPWTVNMLVEAIAHPLYRPEIDLGRSADQEAMLRLFNKTDGGPEGRGYKEGVVYLPRPWINTYEWSHAYEGKRGDMLVHFPGMGDDRWSHMSNWLDIVERTPEKWEVPLEETDYPSKTKEFWTQFRTARDTAFRAERDLEAAPEGTGDMSRLAVWFLREALQEHGDEPEQVRQRLEDLVAAASWDQLQSFTG